LSLEFDPFFFGSDVSRDHVHFTFLLRKGLTHHDHGFDGGQTDLGKISHGGLLDEHVGFATFDLIELSSSSHGSALHGGMDFHESLEALSLGLEGGKLLDVILDHGFFDLRFDHFSD